jgi:uncharacterized membrane protein
MFCEPGWSGGWLFGGWIVPGAFLLILLAGAVWWLSRGTPAKAQATEACPNCSGPVQQVYFRCPHCGDALKGHCPGCSRVVERAWDFCPYCRAALKADRVRPTTTITTDEQTHKP